MVTRIPLTDTIRSTAKQNVEPNGFGNIGNLSRLNKKQRVVRLAKPGRGRQCRQCHIWYYPCDMWTVGLCSLKCRIESYKPYIAALDWPERDWNEQKEYDPLFVESHHVLYPTWNGMMTRCYSETATGYVDYGGRGIKVCERWHIFKNFVQDMGLKPEPANKFSINRKDNDGNYCLENCEWTITFFQSINKRTSTWRKKIQYIGLPLYCPILKTVTAGATTSTDTN